MKQAAVESLIRHAYGRHAGASSVGNQLPDGDHFSTYCKHSSTYGKTPALMANRFQRFRRDFSTYGPYPGTSTIGSQLLDGDHSNTYDKGCSAYGKDAIVYGKESITYGKDHHLHVWQRLQPHEKDSTAYGKYSCNF